MESNDDAMDQGSDGGASPLRDNDLLDFDDEGGAQVAPAVNPNLLRAQAANGPMPKPNAAGEGVGPLLPPPSVTMRQVTEGTEAAAMLGVISIAAPAVAAPAPAADASAPAPPPADADATVASEKDGEGETTDSDDSEPDERTDEQKESDNFRAAVFAEIKRVEDAGYRFPSASKWDSVVAYLNNKVLFDADGTDITDCATEKKKIGQVAVQEHLLGLTPKGKLRLGAGYHESKRACCTAWHQCVAPVTKSGFLPAHGVRLSWVVQHKLEQPLPLN